MPDNFLNILPEPLSERSRLLHDRERVRSGNFVLYWMRGAVRVEDNPALCAAVALADQWDVPLLVYHGVDERYPWASDRMHTFILEGARDVQRQFRKLRIPYGLHVSRPGHRPAALMELGERACAVITEEFPVSLTTALSATTSSVTTRSRQASRG